MRMVPRRAQRHRDGAVPAICRQGHAPGQAVPPRFRAGVRRGAGRGAEQRGQVSRRAGRLGPARPAERGRSRPRAGSSRHQPDLRPPWRGARQRVHAFDLETIDHEVRESRRRPSGRRQAARPLATDLEPGRGPVRRPPLRRAGLPCRPEPGARVRPEAFESFKAELLETYRTGSLADVTGLSARGSPAGRTGSTTCSATSSGASSASSWRIGSPTTGGPSNGSPTRTRRRSIGWGI